MQDKEDIFEKRLSSFISGEASDEEKSELYSLIHESESYRRRYAKAAKLYALLHVPQLEEKKEQAYQQFHTRIQGEDRKKNSIRVWMRLAGAAIILMALTSAFTIYFYKNKSMPDNGMFCEAIVPLGSQTRIILPDSSVVVLNSGSILKYPVSFGEKERYVYLAGEGYFEVAKDKSKVFQVHAGEAKIEVTGTVFNIRCYPDDVQTKIDLIEGSVHVSVGEKAIALKPNERVIYDRKSGILERSEYETYKAALWTTGRLSFVNTSFREILKEIERKYNVKIQIASRRIDDEFFSGTINADMTLQEVFNFIDVDKKYRFENSENTIVMKDR